MAKRRHAPAQSSLRDVIASLIADRSDPAEFIELVYWSQEPHLLPAIRSLVGMNEETRAALCEYLTTAGDPAKISARRVGHAGLLLAAPKAAGAGADANRPAKGARVN